MLVVSVMQRVFPCCDVLSFFLACWVLSLRMMSGMFFLFVFLCTLKQLIVPDGRSACLMDAIRRTILWRSSSSLYVTFEITSWVVGSRSGLSEIGGVFVASFPSCLVACMRVS